MVRIHEIMHMIHLHNFLTLNHTITAQFSMKLCCFFFMSKRFSQNVGKILDDVMLTCCLAGWDGIFFQCWADIPNILPTCRHVSGQHVIWRGVVNMTQHQYFQLSLWDFGGGIGPPWYDFAPSISLRETSSVSQSPSVLSKSSSSSVRSFSNSLYREYSGVCSFLLRLHWDLLFHT